jgi:hypothetical protein
MVDARNSVTVRTPVDAAESIMSLVDTQEAPAPKTWPSGAARGIQKVKYTHDAMVDILIAEPTISQNDLADRFGYTAGWISQIIASDSFQARLAERKDEIVDPTIRATVKDNFEALVVRSQALLLEKLNRPAAQLPDQLVLRSLEVGSKALGFGARDSTVAVQVNVGDYLEQHAENLTKLLARKRAEAAVIDQED